MDIPARLLRDLGLKPNHGLSARELLRRLGAAQQGQYGTRQALALGLTPGQLRAMRAGGEAEVVRPGVARFVAGDEPDPAVAAFLACWPNAVISDASAAQHHGHTCLGAGRPVSHRSARLVMPAARDQCPLSTSLPDSDILKSGPLRYTGLARTVCDLADASHPWETLSNLDDAVALGAKPRWINDVAAALSRGAKALPSSSAPRARAPPMNSARGWSGRVRRCSGSAVYRIRCGTSRYETTAA